MWRRKPGVGGNESGKKPSYSREPEPDVSELAQEAVKAGILAQEVLDHLISLHPQVPNVVKIKYLVTQVHETLKKNQELFLGVLQVFLAFRSHTIAQKHVSREDFSLTTEHIPDLAEFLVPYCFQWRDIGTALRFKPQNLDCIQSSQNRGDIINLPKNCLLKLLASWVQKEHKYTLPPTVNVLENVLYSQLVGLGELACEARTKLAPKQCSTATGPALPYFVASLSVKMADKEVCITPKYDIPHKHELNVEQKGSVLLEVQVNAEETIVLKQINYDWFMNGMPILGSTIHTGTNTPILCVANADIDMDGSEYSCQVTINDTSTYYTRPIVIKVSSPLDMYMYSLASMYKAQPEIPRDTWPPVCCKKHMDLALIKQDQMNFGAEYARVTIRGDMDDILQHKQKIEYNEVIHCLKSDHVMLIEGRPGCGKTTFVHKITRDWATESIKFNTRLRLVLLVSLRVLNGLNKPYLDLEDILYLFKDLKVTKDLIEEADGKGVCFIFDGFDEFAPRDGLESLVYKIIRKEYLNECTVIVASRPAAVAELRSRAEKIIEVLGFSCTQIYAYFDNYPFSNWSKCADLKAYLLDHPNILHMCYLPIHAAMVAFLFEKTGDVPKTETEIYTHFTRFTLKRSFSKHGGHSVDVRNLSGDEKVLFSQICKLALDKTILNKQVLDQDDIQSHFKLGSSGDVSLGLITIDRTAGLYGFEDTYTFLHLTFQEYLAAYHISTLSDEEQYKLIQEFGGEKHMLVVWKFYCGLVEFSAEDVKFKAILAKTAGPAQTLFHTQCAYESQQPLPCSLVSDFRKGSITHRDKNLTLPDLKAIGYVLSKSRHPVKLTLANCSIKYHIGAMDSLLRNISFVLTELDLSGNELGTIGTEFLLSALTCCHKLTKINIHNNGLSINEVFAVFSSIGHQHILELSSFDVTTGNAVAHEQFSQYILKWCSNLRSLETLLILGAVKQLIPYLRPSLRELKVYASKHEGIMATTMISRHISSDLHGLRTVLLDNFSMLGGATKILAECLSQCPNLQILDLSNSRNLETAGIDAIAASLKNCTNLKELYLNCCEVDDKGAKVLSLYLKHYPNLRHLSLYGNKMGKVAIGALANSVHSLELCLSSNKSVVL